MNSPPLLQVENLTKSFPGVRALKQIYLRLEQNEVLGVIGENGAGKSTLMKILAGVQSADSGRVLIDGNPVVFENTRAAMQAGVVLIHQELNLCDNLNVGENIFLGREPRSLGIINRREILRRSTEFLERVGLDVSPTTILGSLTIGRQQMVEIAKALSVDARILIMDEPTSSLSAVETETLFQLIEKLHEQGVSVIYISHRLSEVQRLCDRVTVFRDGENSGELLGEEINHDNMVRCMVGRDISQIFKRSHHEIGNPVLEVKDLVTPTWPKHKLSFSVRAGEIVGVSGLIGAGRTELLRVLFGVERALSGQILIDDHPVTVSTPAVAIDHGFALVPEDRKQHGLILDFSIRSNIGLAGLYRNRGPLGSVNFTAQKRATSEVINSLDIRTSTATQLTKFLSGGNQQKVVIGKWLSMNPKLLLLDEPTRGIDVAAKQEIYGLMEEFASRSMAVLFVSSELDEILGMADRVIVMHEGRIMGEQTRAEMTEESIMRLATGNQTVSPTF